MRRVLLLAALAGLGCQRRPPVPPADATGTLIFVSDRSGVDSLYMRKLPGDLDLQLSFLAEPAREPALSPDAQHVAFALGGRIAVVAVATHDVRYLSLGVRAKDAAPTWHPDGRRLVIASRRTEGESADLWELTLATDAVESPRRRLTETPADESEPVYGGDGSFVVFVREANLYRLDLEGGRVRRLTGGFRKTRQPRLMPDGRILCLWSEGKQYGIDVLDADGRNHQTLSQGSTFYRTVAPGPDGRYLVATHTYDLGFRPIDALTRRGNQELRLLDARGRDLMPLTHGWRDSSHSAVWRR